MGIIRQQIVQLVVSLVNVPLCLFGGVFAYYLFIASGFLLLSFSQLVAEAGTELQSRRGKEGGNS
jgi:hypothetical protein